MSIICATSVRFKCNGGTDTKSKERFIEDPHGVGALMEASLTVSREQVGQGE